MLSIRRLATVPLFASFALTAGCTATATTGPLIDDAGPDAANAIPDAGPDTSTPDATPDAAPDAAPDAPPDAPKSPSAGDSCADAIDISSSVGSTYTAPAAHASTVTDPGSCSVTGAAAKAYYTVTFKDPGNYHLYLATLEGFDTPPGTDASLFLRASCSDPKSELACSRTGTRELSVGFGAPTTVSLVVDGEVFAEAPYAIHIDKDTACTSNADCVPFGASTYCDPTGACTLPLACAAPKADCDKSWADGCEVDTSSDDRNCGACGNVCGTAISGDVSHCVAGACQDSCSAGFTDCNGKPSDGCECGPQPGASGATCSAGTCTLTCEDGYGDCNGVAADGCEASLRSSNTSCGACGHACGAGASCVEGTCEPASTPVVSSDGALEYIAGFVGDATTMYVLQIDYGGCTGYVSTLPYGSKTLTKLATGLCNPTMLVADADALYTLGAATANGQLSILRIAKAGGAVTTVGPVSAVVESIDVDDTNVYYRTAAASSLDTPKLFALPKAGGGTSAQIADDCFSFALGPDATYIGGAVSITSLPKVAGSPVFYGAVAEAGALLVHAGELYAAADGSVDRFAAGTTSGAFDLAVPLTPWTSGSHLAASDTALYLPSRTGIARLTFATGAVDFPAQVDSTSGEPLVVVGPDALYYALPQQIRRIPL